MKLILSHEKRGEMLAGQFPVAAEMLQHLCGHPNLYLSGRADKEGSDSECQSAIFLSRREPELYHTHHDELIVGVSMEDYEGVPVIRLDRSCRGKTQGCSMVCYSERNLRLLHFFRTFGIGGMLYVSSLKAGGTGLNLTAADMVIILDSWWNPAAEDQAADRAHRIGQPREVTVYRFVCRNTIEEKVLKLKKRKLRLVDAFLAGAASTVAFTLDELRRLL